MQCSNNLKQMGLAVHNYHGVYQSFPAAYNPCHSTNGTLASRRFSATYCLLPFMEQTALFDAIKTTVVNPWDGTSATHITRQNVTTLLCPSEENSKTAGPNCARGNVVVSFGDGALEISDYSHIGGGNNDVSTRGLFYPQFWKSIVAITDGTSNTTAISECIAAATQGNNQIKGGVATVTGIQGSAYSNRELIPSACIAVKNGTTFSGNASNVWRCTRYLDGLVLYTGFNTIMPPNAPSCGRTNSEIVWGLYTASSNHTGGVNCGESQSLRKTINY